MIFRKTILALITLFISCNIIAQEIKVINEENYALNIAPIQKAALILFPCYPCDIENTKQEAAFLKDIEKEGITTLLLGFNQRIYLSEKEKAEYSQVINSIFEKNKIKNQNVFIGGFSSGGNVSVLLGNYLLKTKNPIQPKGVFAIDSPIDIEKLYLDAVNDISKNANNEAMEEAKYIINSLEREIGIPKQPGNRYTELSPYIISSNTTGNIEYLKDIKVRFYTEVDPQQLELKQRKYEDINAFMLEKTYDSLRRLGNKKAEFIKTTNRGIRANGEKNTHSWNLVERTSLIKWMIE